MKHGLLDLYDAFSKSLLRAREAKGMTQEDLAKRLKVTRQAVSKYEKGSIPGKSKRCALAALFGEESEVILAFDKCPKDKRAKQFYRGAVRIQMEVERLEKENSIDMSTIKEILHQVAKELDLL